MTTRRKTSRKKRAPAKKKASKKKTVLLSALAIVGLAGYWIYTLVSAGPGVNVPPFEVYPRTGTEAKVEQIDRGISDALLALNVGVDDVDFRSVTTKKDEKEEWTFSVLEIQAPGDVAQARIKEVFSERLSRAVPSSSLQFSSGPKNETTLSLSVRGRPTHRLVFVTPEKDRRRISKPQRPLVAIIIDDLGYDKNIASKFLGLDALLSFSVLPYSPFQKSIASNAHGSGRDVLLHLPMEPLEYPRVDPGDGTLLSSMGPDELVDKLTKSLDEVPFVGGVNNHMGSKLTQDSAKMRQVFTVLKKRNLFFVDSLTTPRSRCAQLADMLQLKFARRNVFLDNTQEAGAIRLQIKRLLSIAKARGRAIGIAHPHTVTWEVLKQELPRILDEVEIVRVSDLVG